MGDIAAVNIMPALLAPKPTGYESGKGKATAGKIKYESQKDVWTKLT